MIVVAGEALMDVLAGPDGQLTALPGGAPFNVARAVARLGAPCTFLGRLSDDAFGDRLRAALADEGVSLAVPAPSAAPTPLAVAELDATGSARYRFYHDHTAAARLFAEAIAPDLLTRADAIVFGGIAMTLEPAASTLRSVVDGAPDDVLVLCDPNCRPGAIHDPPAYRGTMFAALGRVDLVKASVEDLALLCPGEPVVDAARRLIAAGPAGVLVTDGPEPVRIVTAGELRSVPVTPVEVVDTIGAGDAFMAGLVTWWTSRGLAHTLGGDAATLEAATRAAIEVAARACRVQGAGLSA